MKRLLLMLLVAGVSLGALAAAPTSVQFSGSVREASATPVRFDVAVPVKQHATLVLENGTKLELFTPGSPAHVNAQVRLMSATGAVLHTATFGKSLKSRSLAYVICGSRVVYGSPAPAQEPSCTNP